MGAVTILTAAVLAAALLLVRDQRPESGSLRLRRSGRCVRFLAWAPVFLALAVATSSNGTFEAAAATTPSGAATTATSNAYDGSGQLSHRSSATVVPELAAISTDPASTHARIAKLTPSSAAVVAAEAGAGADNVVNGLRLRAQLTGDEIARGHAFDKHIAEFSGITTRDQFARTIEDAVMNGEIRTLSNGRTAYWYDGTVVIRNPEAADGGTAFRPTDGYDYFLGLY